MTVDGEYVYEIGKNRGPFYKHRLTHWGRVTHICVGNLTIIGSDNGVSPGRRQAIIWTNAGILLIGPLGTNFSGILVEIIKFSFKKMCLKGSSAKWRPFCLGLNVLTLISAGLRQCIRYQVCGEVTYPFPNFNGDSWAPKSRQSIIETNQYIVNWNAHMKKFSCILTRM